MRSLVLYNVVRFTVAATIPGSCSFPGQGSMVAVRTNGKNAGWAMHSDQECKPGTYCPYACPPGQLMAQWDPSSTSYTYPGSRNGGLYCDKSGNLQKSFPDKPYCYQGKGTVSAKNSAGGQVAFCQTVLPGDEEMLIPTVVGSGSSQTLAVPGPEYWAGTAAHYYVNPPGVSADDGCVWGSEDKAVGNWAPYVAGMNQDADGNTFVTLGWNPKFLEIGKPKPDFGLKISCADGDCAGTPCAIDPSNGGENEVSGSQSKGAGGANFCVVTAKNGAKAVIELFSAGSDKSKREEEHHMHRAHDDQLDERSVTVFASNSDSAKDEGVTSLRTNSSDSTSYHVHHSYKQEKVGNRVLTTTFNASA